MAGAGRDGAFHQRKAVVLAGLAADCGDKSRKGSVDAPVADLVAAINAHPGVYTTSSCSGRVTVFGEPSDATRAAGKKGGEWVYASHEPADTEAVIRAIHERCVSGVRLVLRFEPFILHLEACSAAMGQAVLGAARAAGFRESGITLGSGGRRVMVGVRCSLRLEVPVADGGAVLVPDSYLRYVIDLANDKFQQNMQRIKKFEQELLPVLQAHGGGGGGDGGFGAGHVSVATPAAGAANGGGKGSEGGRGRDGGLAAVPGRVRGGRGAAGAAGGGADAGRWEALRRRQKALLGRIQGVAGKLLVGGAGAGVTAAGSAAAAVRPGGKGEPARVGRPAAPAPAVKAAAAPAAAAKAKGSRKVTVAGADARGTGSLCWQLIPVPQEQGSVGETVPRWGHASAAAGGKVALIGGYGGGGAHARRSDVLLYDTARRTWEALEPAAAPAGADDGAQPPPRMGHAAACLAGRYVVLIGGRTSPSDALSDVWLLDLYGSGRWVRVVPEVVPCTPVAAAGPPAWPGRFRHSAVAVPPKGCVNTAAAGSGPGAGRGAGGAELLEGWRVVVYGGRTADTVLGDTWVLSRTGSGGGSGGGGKAGGDGGGDVAKGWRWQQVATAAGAPCPRKSHAACYLPPAAGEGAAAAGSGRMYVHGGTCGYGMHFDDLYYLDLDTYTWHCVYGGSGDGRGGGGGGDGGGVNPRPPACFSHTLNAWGRLLLLVGGYPTHHHTQLWVLDTRDHTWHAYDTHAAAGGQHAAAAAVDSRLEFLPVRHCAEVVSASGGAGAGGGGGCSDKLLLFGGGAFCFSFGTVFGGCYELGLGNLAAVMQRDAAAARVTEANRGASGEGGSGATAGGDRGGGGQGGEAVEGWVVAVPSRSAKGVKDALKARGWLDSGRRGGSSQQQEDAGGARTVLLPVTAEAGAVLSAASCPASPAAVAGEAHADAAVRSVLEAAGAQVRLCRLPPATRVPPSPVQRLRDAVLALLRASPYVQEQLTAQQQQVQQGGGSVGGGGGAGSSVGAEGDALVQQQGSADAQDDPLLRLPLVQRLLAEVPSRWERLGDLVLLPSAALASPEWLSVMAAAPGGGGSGGGGGEGGEGGGGGGAAGGGADPLLPLWRAVAEALGVARVARQAPVANTGTRDSQAVLLLGSDGWVTHREGGVSYSLDVTRCMFSSGNVTERTRIGRLQLRGSGGGGKGAQSKEGQQQQQQQQQEEQDGEVVVDLYTGIGYYTLPLLVVAGAKKVYACEWNPHALEALRRNLQQPPLVGGPPVATRCHVLPGDCRTTAPAGVADRVMLGLLPSSKGGWETAIRALKPQGGWLHLHHNVTDSEEAAWLQQTMDELRKLAEAAGRRWQLHLRHVERVKWYAPHIRHIVMDIECCPAEASAGEAATATPAAATITTTDTSNHQQPDRVLFIPATRSSKRLEPGPTFPDTPAAQPSANSTPPPVAACAVSSTQRTQPQQQHHGKQQLQQPHGGPPAGHWCRVLAPGAQWTHGSVPPAPLRAVRHVDVGPGGGMAREAFERDVSAPREPVVLRGLDLGPAPKLWGAQYFLSLPEAKTTLVSVHVTRDLSGCLDFVHKNFAFRTMTLDELVRRVAGAPGPGAGGGWPELVPRGPEFGEGEEVLYLRSIGENPRKEPASLSASFPRLASDLALPPLFEPDRLHSSVLRVSSPGMVLWTHYDVMDNVLIQLCGTKRVLLWPPSAHDALHVAGSSSPIVQLGAPDLGTYPRFARCPPPLVADLSPGDVLFLPSLWLHNVTAMPDSGAPGGTVTAAAAAVAGIAGGSLPLPLGGMSVSVNAFWRHLPEDCYHKKDLYGNRDLVQAEAADKAAEEVVSHLGPLPRHYRAFYGERLMHNLQRALGLEGEKGEEEG